MSKRRQRREGSGASAQLPKENRPSKPHDLTFEGARSKFLDWIWKIVPSPVRIPLAAVIVIGGLAYASGSVWYPPLRDWFNKPVPRVMIGGEVFTAKNQPLANGEVQLLDRSRTVIATASTDSGGYVTFNVAANEKVALLRCSDAAGHPVDLPLEARELKSGKTFNARVDLKRVSYHES